MILKKLNNFMFNYSIMRRIIGLYKQVLFRDILTKDDMPSLKSLIRLEKPIACFEYVRSMRASCVLLENNKLDYLLTPDQKIYYSDEQKGYLKECIPKTKHRINPNMLINGYQLWEYIELYSCKNYTEPSINAFIEYRSSG